MIQLGRRERVDYVTLYTHTHTIHESCEAIIVQTTMTPSTIMCSENGCHRWVGGQVGAQHLLIAPYSVDANAACAVEPPLRSVHTQVQLSIWEDMGRYSHREAHRDFGIYLLLSHCFALSELLRDGRLDRICLDALLHHLDVGHVDQT